MKKRSLKQILSGTSTVKNPFPPKTRPSAAPRTTKGPAKLMKGNTFGKGWGG